MRYIKSPLVKKCWGVGKGQDHHIHSYLCVDQEVIVSGLKFYTKNVKQW